ncbi:MAG: formylglycine-generating enzyme family protein [Rhodopila sp.]
MIVSPGVFLQPNEHVGVMVALTAVVPAHRAEGMVSIPGGTFLMGSDRHYPEEAPAHRETISPFWIDPTLVTNRQFRRFVQATGYITVAEKAPDPRGYRQLERPHLQ